MLLRSSLILCLSIISGCAGQAPAPPVVRECRLIRMPNLDQSYLYCVKTDGSNFEERIKLVDLPVKPEDGEKFIVCTTLNDYTTGKAYQKKLTGWIKDHCGGR